MTSCTISLDEYKQLITRAGWQRKTELRSTLSQPVPIPSALGTEIILTRHAGWATVSSFRDGVSIIYKEKYSHVGFDELSLSTSTDGNFNVWTIEGVAVVDEAGARVSNGKLGELLADEFSFIDYYQLGLSVVEDVDPKVKSLEQGTMIFHNRCNARFTGNLIAGNASSPNRKDPNFSGVAGSWYENKLYITRGGRYVCSQLWTSLNPETDDICLGAVCDTIGEVAEFFGQHPLSHKLYQQAGETMIMVVAGSLIPALEGNTPTNP